MLHAATPDQMNGEHSVRHSITRRELECLEHALRGCSTRQVARELGISTQTVNGHLGSAYRKCHVSGRDELFGRLF
jgi:DNA-binding CsgD family transcriptional regulator